MAGPGHPGPVAGPEEGTLVALAVAAARCVAARRAALVEQLYPDPEGARGGTAEVLPTEVPPAPGEGVDVEGVGGHLVIRSPVPGLGLHQAALDAIRSLQAEQELQAGHQWARACIVAPGPAGLAGRIQAQALQGVKLEGGYPGLVEGRHVAGPRVARPAAGARRVEGFRVVGIAAVAALLPGQEGDGSPRCEFEHRVAGEGEGLGQARQAPGALGGNGLLQGRIAQVGLGVEHRGACQDFTLAGGEALAEGVQDFPQGIAAATTVDDVVRRVEGIVAARAEGPGGAVLLPHQALGHPQGDAPRGVEERIAVSGAQTRQGTGEGGHVGILARVFHAVVRTHETAALLLGQEPGEDAL